MISHAPLAQGRDHLVQPARLGDRQAGRRLVHDEEPGVERQRLRDLDQLAPRDRQRGQWRVRRDVQAELIEVRPHGLAHLRAIDQPQHTPARRFASEQDVAGDVEIVEQVELLVDERDPQRRRAGDAAHDDRRAVDQHLAGVGLLDPADDLHQGGLAGAVLAEQRHDFSRVHVEAYATERLHAGKPLVDRAELEERRAGHRPRSCASDVLNSSTLFCRITLVGTNTWRPGGMPDRSPLSAFSSSVTDWKPNS